MTTPALRDCAPAAAAPPAAAPDLLPYLEAVLASLAPPAAPAAPPGREAAAAAERTAAAVFAVLTDREFCYLSKAGVEPYREDALRWMAADVRAGRPIRFYFDIGGGYHASIRPGDEPLGFDAGLAELLVLSQICRFARRVSAAYPPGVAFTLVIDNLCALLINDIPPACTAAYCARLRALIHEIGLQRLVDVLVESERFSTPDLLRLAASEPPPGAVAELTAQQHRNVERFLGRPCDAPEARQRFHRYQEIIDASEALLVSCIYGVHMTQRASTTTLCFRPFPGGDSRIQCGEVVVTRNSKGRLTPFLLTSKSAPDYRCSTHRFPAILPAAVRHVTYAERRAPGGLSCQ